MEKLFGVPINNLLYGLLVILAVGLTVLIVSALRNLVLFKTGFRNITRHPIQTSLIILGLMLATLLISAALITGDTMSYSIRKTALDDLGLVDEIVQVKSKEAKGNNFMDVGQANANNSYFEREYLQKVENALPDRLVDGVSPVMREQAPAAAPKSRRNLPNLRILGVESGYSTAIAPLRSKNGSRLSLKGLGENEAYFNKEAAEKLDLEVGDEVKLFIQSSPQKMEVAGIYSSGGKPAGGPSIVMSLSRLQKLYSTQDKFNAILISNKGNELDGVKHTKAVLKQLKPVLKGSRLEAKSVKKEALDSAEKGASSFTSIFLVFGQFSTIAGIMLIFLIFIMLAAERKVELGVLRALGSQSRDILRIFLFEGSVYAVIAAAIGSVLGVGVGWGMVKILAKAFGGFQNFKLYYHFDIKSLMIAYALGVIATFVIVVFSAWRAGHVNIVRAIRDLPEPQKKGTTAKRLVLSIGLLVFGSLLVASGINANQASPFFAGMSFVVVGVPLLARCLRLPDRAAFSMGGAGLILLWLLPDRMLGQLLPWSKGMKSGIEMFFISGVAIVTGAVWVVMYNSDIILAVVTAVFGRLKGLPPMLKIAVNYPMKNRFRTGLALAMFSLIIFTMTFMSALLASFNPIYEDVNGLSGGFHIRGITGYTNPVKDMSKTLDKNGKGVSSDDFEAIGSFSMAGVNVRQVNAKKKTWVQYVIQGIDAGYANNVNYKMNSMAEGYKSSREIWKALVDEPNVAVVHTNLVPAKTDYEVGEEAPPFRFSGFYRENKKLPKIYIEVRNPATGKKTKLRVIGVAKEMALYTYGGIFTSQKTVNNAMKVEIPPVQQVTLGGNAQLQDQTSQATASKQAPQSAEAAKTQSPQGLAMVMPQSVPATTYWFRVKSGVDIEKASNALAKTFYKNGMETALLKEDIKNFTEMNQMINRLLQGFMGLGLVVGIAALGVIAARSVVERRKQIGMLRAIGFRKGMVQNTFLLESSFVALLGVAIGTALGLTLSQKVAVFMAKSMPGIAFVIPWTDVAFIAFLAYGASLLTTYLPAVQAARVYPAEALRYE